MHPHKERMHKVHKESIEMQSRYTGSYLITQTEQFRQSKYIGNSREMPQAECLAKSGERKLED